MPKRKQLRKENLIQAANAALSEMSKLSPSKNPINISSLAKYIGVTRQAIYNNNLQNSVIKFAELQKRNFTLEPNKKKKRRSLEERISLLENENKDLKGKLDSYIEIWVKVEYNAKMLGINADVLFAPIPTPLRKTLIFKNKTSK